MSGVLALLHAWLPLLVVLSLFASVLSWWFMWRLSKSEIAALAKRIGVLENRESMRPTAEDTHLLRLDMRVFTEKMEGFTRRMDVDRERAVEELRSARELFAVQIEAAEGLVVRTERSVEETGKNLRMVLEHMLAKGH